MAMENHANDANVTELNAHIVRLTAKLEAMTPGTEQPAESVTLLEEYYERLLQIREMSITTATEALAEAQTTHARRQRTLVAIVLMLVCYVIVVVEAHAPGQIATPIKRACAKVASSTTLVALISATTAHAATRWRGM